MASDFSITSSNSINFADTSQTSKMSVQDMVLIVTLQTYGSQSQKLTQKLEKMQAENIKLQNLNAGLAVLNEKIKNNVTFNPQSDTIKITDESTGEAKSITILAFLEKYNGGSPGGADSVTIDELKGAINRNLKPAADKISSTSSLDQIEVQRASNNINNTFTMATNLISKFYKLNESILGNTR